MLFNSFSFIVFLPIVVILYYIFPHKLRWLLLLVASCYFYMAFVPKYILILFALIIVDYFLAIFLENETDQKKKKLALVFGIISNVSLLFVFKYFNFFNENVASLAHLLGWNYSVGFLRLALPLGLSFHTFQSLSYLIEVYRGTQKAEKHFGIYSLFVLFFPQLVAGPIERASHMMHQFHEEHPLVWKNIVGGLKLIIWGFFLKIVVADRASLLVDAFYTHPEKFVGPAGALALVLFAFQLYGDFAGYTFIALGSAQMLGFELSENFRRPYLAKSISEFWQRWHISLSSWLRDYVYQGVLSAHKRVSLRALYTAIVITFLLSGIWHGAGWTFVCMGLFYGILIVLGVATKKWRDRFMSTLGLNNKSKVRIFIQTITTFGLVCIGWLFFRSPNMATVLEILEKVSTGWREFFTHFYNTAYLKQHFRYRYEGLEVIETLIFSALLFCIEFVQEKDLDFVKEKIVSNLYAQTFIYTVLILTIIVFGQFHQKVFIYFQF